MIGMGATLPPIESVDPSRAGAGGARLVGMGGVPVALQIGVCALISIAAVLGLVVVWRDDHKWVERDKDAAPVTEPGPYPLDLRELAHRPVHHGRS